MNDRWNVIALTGALTLLLATAHGYLPFVADDALISFRYSERLLDGKGLTFTDGERVEGYSNLLWVLIVAGGGLVTRDLILVGRVAGAVAMGLALLAFLPMLRALASRSAATGAAGPSPFMAAIPGLAGLLLLALSHGLAIWAIGGLEQGLQIGLLAWALTLLITPSLRASAPDAAAVPLRAASIPRAAGVVLALLVWTRPDGALFVGLAALAPIVVHGVSVDTGRGIVRLAALPALAWLGQLAFRLVYYGDWLPNTAYAKVAISAAHVWSGLRYIGEGLWMHAAIVAAAIVGLLFARPFRRARSCFRSSSPSAGPPT